MTHHILVANVRLSLSARVIQALVDSGCTDLFVQDVRRVVPGLDPASYDYSVRMGQAFEPMVRLEAIGSPDEVRRWADALRRAASTSRHGDGIVSVVTAVNFLHLSEGTAYPSEGGPR